MTTLTYIALGLGAAFLVLFMVKCCKQRSVEGVFIKNIVSLFFLMTSITGTLANPEYWELGISIIAGGIFGMLGDIYLDQKWVYPEHNDQYLFAGFTCFGVGHLIYIAGLLHQVEFTAKDFIIPAVCSVVVAVGQLILEKPTKQKFGKFKPILVIYCLILPFAMGLAFAAGYKTQQMAYMIYAIGMVMFLISDIILSPMYFAIAKDKNTPINFILNHGTYYIAQFMIAFSITLLK